ncbi:MAG: methylmalonyl-CoA mutase [Dehalococcoidia bacterium]|nr:MAG: methylmalonyl-CoA mutase [Dehalococcoidia bacterium]
MSGFERWQREVYEPARARAPERRAQFETTSGIPIAPLYTPEHRAGHDYEQEVGYPGEFPFTRGVQPTMYRSRFWTMRQYAGFGTAEESNRRFRYLLANGQTGLSVAFDLPTQIGYDSDHPLALPEVGKVGVAISTLEDMEVLFRDIPLDQVSTSMTINATAATLLALYIAVAKRQGVAPRQLAGTTQNDILKEYVARGTYIYPPGPSMRLITDMFRYCAEELPRWNPISISGYHMREAGCTAAQEVGFTLAHGIAYVQAAIDAGLEVDRFAPRLSFFFVAQSNFFEEIAKFRAARRLWARIMRDRFRANDPRSWMLRFHTQTAGVSLTAQQPENNVVRTALQALSAVLGGTQSLHTNSKDEALGLPTAEAAQLALRTQQIIAYETGVGDTVDPLAGSYYVESLTDAIERRAQEYIEQIDALGGAVRAIEQGFEQREIQEAAYRLQQEIERGERVIVGVNKFQVPEEIPIPILRVDPRAREEQIRRLQQFRARRDQGAVARCLEDLRQAAAGSENLMPRILAAVEHGATVGEIADTLRAVFGVHKETVVI